MKRSFSPPVRRWWSICSSAASWFGKYAAVIVLLPIVGWSSISAAEVTVSLVDAVRMAQEKSFAVASARHTAAAAEFNHAATRAGRLPVFSLDATSFFLSKIQTIDLPTGSREIGSKENYRFDVRLSAPLYTGGRIANGVAVSEAYRRAAEKTVESEQLTIAYECRRAYLNLMSARAMLQAAESSVDRLSIIDTNVQNLYDNGMADSLDILDAELAMEMGNREVERYRAIYSGARVTLAGLIGDDRTMMILPADSAPFPRKPAHDDTLLPTTIDRPDLTRFDHLIAAADGLAAVHKSSYYPNVSGFAGYTYGMPNQDMFNHTWNDYFTVGLTLGWSFNIGRQSIRQVQAAKEEAASTRMAQKELLDALRTQRDAAWENLEFAYRACLISQQEYDIAGRQYRLARLSQDEGRLTVNRLLEIEADLAVTERQYQAAIINYYLAESEYLYIVGSPRLFGGIL